MNVEDVTALAKEALPRATFDYISTGSADEITLRENIAAFRRIRVLPPLLKGVSKVDLSTTVLKQRISLPIMLAPVAAQRMYHPQGALAVARAAVAAGTVFGVSSSATNSVEEIAAASRGPKWFQLYVPKDRAVTRQLVQRVERTGFKAIIVTVDLGEWKDADRRNRFALPKEMLVKHLRDVGFDQVSNKMSYQEVFAFNERAWDISLSWEFFEWLRSITKLPLLIKGVLRQQDAEKAVSLGLDGIVVSNHGGRRLDGMPASIDRLSDIVEVVGDRAEVYMDGGVRRGTDVLKALALGARAVLIGRPYAWGLAANGEAGVREGIELLREETLNAMLTSGCAKVADIERSLIMT
ncbi:MAG: alpha-hydroxy-acid oxidizing enzyme [Planctomycetaceae bacterium]|nr:alpha-hydroxy-acid oxidizing enzyme [Planctomycetaceae bacterium]